MSNKLSEYPAISSSVVYAKAVYINHIIFMYMGGFMMAMAMENFYHLNA